jgi:hypothetical protein
MAKIKQTNRDQQQQFRDSLRDPQQRRAFDQLAKLIAHPRDDLKWHHKMGVLVDRFRQPTPHGAASPKVLAEALGPSRELLAKARLFAELYPNSKDLRELEDMRVTWTRLYFSFAVTGPPALPRLARRGHPQQLDR